MTDEFGNAFRVALTGGIASGKTAVAEAFAALGICIIDTDQISRDIVQPGTPALEAIAGYFGPNYIDEAGHLDRRRLRERVFANPADRKALENITHPAIREELRRRSLDAQSPYQIHAIPLFAEGGGKGNYDRVLVVDCPEDLQILRLMRRDHVDEVQARRVLAAQATRQQRLAYATDVITNEGTMDELKGRVQTLHELYLELARAKLANKRNAD